MEIEQRVRGPAELRRRKIKAIQRRHDYLKDKEGSFNVAEASALSWALKELEASHEVRLKLRSAARFGPSCGYECTLCSYLEELCGRCKTEIALRARIKQLESESV